MVLVEESYELMQVKGPVRSKQRTTEGREAKNEIDRKEVVCWLLNVPATCQCISGTDLLRQFDMLPH